MRARLARDARTTRLRESLVVSRPQPLKHHPHLLPRPRRMGEHRVRPLLPGPGLPVPSPVTVSSSMMFLVISGVPFTTWNLPLGAPPTTGWSGLG